MKNLSILTVFILLLQFGYCSSSYSVIANPQTNIVEPFKDFFERFIRAFNEKNTAEINKYIYSEFGLFVLDNPGAFTVVERFNSFDDIMKLESGYNIGFLKVCKVDCKFKEGSIPYYNCGDDEIEGWNKKGCFYDKNQMLLITGFYKTMLEFKLGDINAIKTEMTLAEKSEKYITHLAYSTEGSIGFYFGIIDNNWYLICIDKITPCDA